MQTAVDGDSGSNSLEGTDANEVISGLDGNDDILGQGGEDLLFGGSGQDYLRGGEGDDTLCGDSDNDILFGGDGNDLLFGDDGDDIIRGQKGFNIYVGGDGNDTLTGLGELKRNIFNQVIEGEEPEDYDTFTGGSGADTFELRRATDDEGRLFVSGQKFAYITDFDPTNEGDKILLPGSQEDYQGVPFGENNEGTAIFYTEDPDIDISIGFGGLSIGTGLAIDIPNQTALVAVIENVAVRNMQNSNFYEYAG